MVDPGAPVFDAVRGGKSIIKQLGCRTSMARSMKSASPRRICLESRICPSASCLRLSSMKASFANGTGIELRHRYWGVGGIDKSGHGVEQYTNHPSTILRCREVYEWLLHTKYLLEVIRALGNFSLTEFRRCAVVSPEH